jgi:hypothetical protein
MSGLCKGGQMKLWTPRRDAKTKEMSSLTDCLHTLLITWFCKMGDMEKALEVLL